MTDQDLARLPINGTQDNAAASSIATEQRVVPAGLGLKINPEYEALMSKYKLSHAEYDALKESIRINGLYYPIDINPDGVILDGHTRYKICRELGIEPKLHVRKFANELLEKQFVIEINLRRRQLNEYQRIEASKPLLEIQEKLAAIREVEWGKAHGRPPVAPFGATATGKAVDIVAKMAGVSVRTYERGKKVMELAPERMKERLRAGSTSINAAYDYLRRHETLKPPPIPKGKYSILYADPPWQYYFSRGGSPNLHYHTLKTEDIARLKIPAAKNAVLFLWATSPKLLDALRVMKRWGFKYKTSIVWVKKNAFGLGYYCREQHEWLLIGKKGNMHPPLEENRPPSVIFADRREHSRKPNEAYEVIEGMYPEPEWKRIELFARYRREGWDYWGSEVADERG